MMYPRQIKLKKSGYSATSTPSPKPTSGKPSARGRFGHKDVSPSTRDQQKSLHLVRIGRVSKTPRPRLQIQHDLSSFAGPSRMLPSSTVSASRQMQAEPLTTWQIAEIALTLSQNIKVHQIHKLLETLPLPALSLKSLYTAYKRNHPLWLFSGIHEALERRKGTDSDVSYLLKALGPSAKPDLAEKITNITNSPADTLQQEPLRLNEYLTENNRSKMTPELKQPLLVGLLSGLPPELVYEMRTQSGAASYQAQKVLFRLQERMGDQSASRFIRALRLTGNGHALEVLGLHSESEHTESVSRSTPTSFPPKRTPEAPTASGCPSDLAGYLPSSHPLTPLEAMVDWPSGSSTFVTSFKCQSFSHDELKLIVSENYQPVEKQKGHTAWTDPNRRNDFIRFCSQFPGLTFKALECNTKKSSGYTKEQYLEFYQQKQVEYLHKVDKSEEVGKAIETSKKKAIEAGRKALSFYEKKEIESDKILRSTKDALIFFAIKAGAMDLAARMCQVMCHGEMGESSREFFRIKSIADTLAL